VSECSHEWEVRQLVQRVAALEAWKAQVQGRRPEPKPEPQPGDEVSTWEQRCREIGATDAELALIRARIGHDTEAHLGWLQERSEEGDLRARARRGGIDLEPDE